MSDAEIGELVGLPAAAVRGRLARALDALAHVLGCSPPEALEAYEQWPVTPAPWTASDALALVSA